jgi:phosphopantothenoylcysteine decarboxylase/phosphopantothenate--cysteine ligase
MQDRLPPMFESLKGKRVLISAGPMRTPVDAVRFIQNRSSGTMGLLLAKAATKRGAQVSVLLGPVGEAQQTRFAEYCVTPYETATDYRQAIETLFPRCDVFLSLAAVLDFEVQATQAKWSREDLGTQLNLPIIAVPDFAAWAGKTKRPNQRVIAFAAEVGTDIVSRAEAKRAKKNADAIVANPVTDKLGPDARDNEFWILRPGQPAVHLGPAPKTDLAEPLLDALFKEGS